MIVLVVPANSVGSARGKASGLLAEIVNLSEGDLSLLIDNKDGAFIDPGNGIAKAHDAVLLRNRTMRIEITS